MAIFRVPRINTSARLDITLEESEIVYDVDLQSFFGGNGYSAGGYEIANVRKINFFNEYIILNAENISTGIIELQYSPDKPESVKFVPVGGIEQVNSVDFAVIENQIVINGFGLENFLEIGDEVLVYYSAYI